MRNPQVQSPYPPAQGTAPIPVRPPDWAAAAETEPPDDTDETEANEENGDVKSTVFEFLDQLGDLVMPLAIALYAVLYISMQYLYGTFGVNPEQAGIDQGVLFGRLLYTLVLLVLLALPVIGIYVSIRWLFQRITGDLHGALVRGMRANPWISAGVLAVVCVVLYWALMPLLLNFVLGASGDNLALNLGLALLLGAVAFIVPMRMLSRSPVGRFTRRVICGALAGVTIGFSLAGTVSEEANLVATQGAESALLNAVGFQDQWVVVQRDDKCLYDGATMLLLGTSEAGYALYDVGLQQAHFLPVGDNVTLDYVMMSPGGADMEAASQACLAEDAAAKKDKDQGD